MSNDFMASLARANEELRSGRARIFDDDLIQSLPEFGVDGILVKVAPEVLRCIKNNDSEPVVVLGVREADDGTRDLVLRSPSFFQVVESALLARGYRPTSDPEYLESPDGSVDKLIPMIIDCLEREC